jgi:hypothetical protein
MHYCKGGLESISVFFSQGCEDHEETEFLPSCCQKEKACTSDNGSCCSDETKVLLQDFDSVPPHFDKWAGISDVTLLTMDPLALDQIELTFMAVQSGSSDSGPPIYILFHSLIYYA